MNLAELFDYFDHVYIVNLPDRNDRRQETVEDLAKAGVSVQSSKIEFFEASRPDDKGQFPSVGALGNLMSQTRVMEDAMKNGYNRILVCEDDLQLVDTDDSTLETVMCGLRSDDWTMALLGYLEPTNQSVKGQGLVSWAGPTRGTQFYAVRGDAIRAFHDYLKLVRIRPPGHPDGGSMFFDGAFNMARVVLPEVRFFIASPCLAGQRPSRTNIHDLAFYDRIEPFRSIAGYLRKLRVRRHLRRSSTSSKPN